MKLNCYIVEDLMPSYIENLTNENTSKDIQEHFIECERCKKTLFRYETGDPPTQKPADG